VVIWHLANMAISVILRLAYSAGVMSPSAGQFWNRANPADKFSRELLVRDWFLRADQLCQTLKTIDEPMRIKLFYRVVIAVVCFAVNSAFCCGAFASDTGVAADVPKVDVATLGRIRDAAMRSDWAWQQLARLTDETGPRLSGSPGLTAAVTQIANTMRLLGAQVTLQAAKIPHWVRGEEQAELVEYPGRHGANQKLRVVALGGSSATPANGSSARVIVVHDFEELKNKAGEVRGNIVLFESRFDQRLADNGYAMDAYGQAGAYRFNGPSAAQALGAIAALVRSIGGADYRLPHTGLTVWKNQQAPIPAAALAAEDADLIERLAGSGPVTLKLLLTPKTLPDTDGSNVIADWPGREKPEEYVIVSGHLDSWDLATGATDDGVGVIGAAAVIQILKQLDLHPRRTIRFVGWTNEENGLRGGSAYFESVRDKIASQVAAIESDNGAGRSLGIAAAVSKDSLEVLQPTVQTLGQIGATVLSRKDDEVGADIGPLQTAGVPGFAPLVDTRHYFDYHHTAADTIDKVDPENLKTQVATMAVLAYYLAELPERLPGFKISP
jgi:carboxypeptidase Q